MAAPGAGAQEAERGGWTFRTGQARLGSATSKAASCSTPVQALQGALGSDDVRRATPQDVWKHQVRPSRPHTLPNYYLYVLDA